MAITLIDESRPATKTYQGSTTVTLAGHQKVLIKAPAGDTLLDAAPGTGKTWEVTVNVYILETTT